MSDAEIFRFLQEEIFGRKKIVSYRLLSRKLSLHVNTAKNALAKFYSQQRPDTVFATYWVSGIQQTDDEDTQMDVDQNGNWDVKSSNEPPSLCQKIAIAVEDDLNDLKASFAEIYSLHIYSLSALPITKSSQLFDSSKDVLTMDKATGSANIQKLGRIISSSTKNWIGGSSKPPMKLAKTEPKAEIKYVADAKRAEPSSACSTEVTKPAKGKPMVSGKLDFSKAKIKDAKKDISNSKTEGNAPTPNMQEKRGIKRKSPIPSEIKTEEAESKASTIKGIVKFNRASSSKDLPTVSIKKGVIVSDNEEDEVAGGSKLNGKRLSKKSSPESDTDPSIRAMMDIDDSEVIRASIPVANDDQSQKEATNKPKTNNTEKEDYMMEDSDDPSQKTKPRKRKEKKSVPIGRNGYKKKRVVRSKTDFDDKGYMVTVDYSSYESVDEEEGMADLEKSRKKKTPAIGTQKIDTMMTETGDKTQKEKQKTVGGSTQKPRPKTKGKPSTNNSGQKGLASYFTNGPKAK